MRTNPVKTGLLDGQTVYGTMVFEFATAALSVVALRKSSQG